MKDLYERLDLSPEATESAIRRRLRRVAGKELERATQEILLHSGRREVYDRNHRLLKTIGNLRARLKLNDGPNWREGEAYRDFSIASKDRPSQSEVWKSRRNFFQGEHWSSSSSTTRNGQGIGSKIVSMGLRILKGIWGAFVAVVSYVSSFVLLMGFLGIVAWGVDQLTNGSTSKSPDEQKEVVTPSGEGGSGLGGGTQEGERALPYDPEPLPENGTWWNYTSDRKIAPLRISVSSGQHYYIKVVNAYTEARVLTLFIRSGRTAEVEVPLGSYKLKYAIGDTWYGRDNYFGPKTRYLEAEDTFDFEIIGDQVRGHRVELILQTGGNLSTERISEGKF